MTEFLTRGSTLLVMEQSVDLQSECRDVGTTIPLRERWIHEGQVTAGE